MNSCIYEGTVRHRRFSPVSHSFRYSLFLMYLDLDELDSVFENRWFWSSRRRNLAWVDRRDHLGAGRGDLAEVRRVLIGGRTVYRGPAVQSPRPGQRPAASSDISVPSSPRDPR